MLNNVAALGGKHLKLGIEGLVAECLQNTARLGRHWLFSLFCIISSEMYIKALMLLTTIQNRFSIFENAVWSEVEGTGHT